MINFAIDLATLTYHAIAGTKTERLDDIVARETPVTSIIPAYNEGVSLIDAVHSQLNQTNIPRRIIIADDHSSDDTMRIGQELASRYPNVTYERNEQNLGKAATINRILRAYDASLTDRILITDGDTQLEPQTVEALASRFTDDAVAAVTANGILKPSGTGLSRLIHQGKAASFNVFAFRKRAQSLRNAVSVVNGSCTMYTADSLRQHPFPERTKTEDTDHTWMLLEAGNKVLYEPRAVNFSTDIEGVRDHYKQTHRWFSGSWQSLYTHGRDLGKAPSLAYTTVHPSFAEGGVYSLLYLVGLPALGAAHLIAPDSVPATWFLAGLAADAAYTALPILAVDPKSIRHLPGIYAYKTIAAAGFLDSGVRTSAQAALGQRERWSNRWTRERKGEV